MKKNAALLSIRGKFSYRQDRIGIVSAKRMNKRAYQGNSVNVGGNFRYFHLKSKTFWSSRRYIDVLKNNKNKAKCQVIRRIL